MAPKNTASLDWQVHYPEVRQRTAHLLHSHEWADCTFQFQPGAGAGGSKDSLDAHRLILAMASPVFAAMFYGHVGDKEGPVFISDIDLPTFSALLVYIYTDEVNLSNTKIAANLYGAANKYILNHLEKQCLDYLLQNLNANNVCYIYEFACLYGENELKKKCLEMFSTKTQYVLKGGSFRNAHVNTLKEIVSMDTLDINSEMDLYKAVLDYVDHFDKPDGEKLAIQFNKDNMECGEDNKQINNKEDNSVISADITIQSITKKLEEARENLQDIIKEIRFLAMTPADLAKISETSALVSKDEMFALLIRLSYPDTKLPMPDGFSCVREPRIRGAATFRHTVQNVKNMTIGQRELSPPCFVRNMPWMIGVTRESRKPSEDFLVLYLQYDIGKESLSEDWSCIVKESITLFSAKPNSTPNLTKGGKCRYTREKRSMGYSEFIEWSQLIDPENNFVKDNSITIEVHFSTEPGRRH